MIPATPFHHLLAPFDVATLHDEPASVCGLTEDLCIAYVNPAWLRFGAANGASPDEGRWGLGARLSDVTPAILQPFYGDLFARARSEGAAVEHEYECSSPATLRRFRMRIHPCAPGAFVVIHSLLRASPHTRTGHAAFDGNYRDEHGQVTQCSNCRLVRRADATRHWEWVPEYVQRPPDKVSHGLCRACSAFYYSEFQSG